MSLHGGMLSVSSLTSPEDEIHEKDEGLPPFSVGLDEFSDGSLLDDISFDDLFIEINDGDVLPDLEVDPEIFAEFSTSGSDLNSSSSSTIERKEKEEKTDEEGCKIQSKGESRREESVVTANSVSSDANRGRKLGSAQVKASQGKRKVKVDWTPELHRRFVQAVEQLGVDKAVPSRILEIMGIDCLTRHNIASHLQKYRSHRKHLLAREAEAANWSQRRQMYGGSGVGCKRDMTPWLPPPPPTIGFPPPPPPPPPALHPFRPLHVWGHPTVDQPLIQVWPKHIVHSPSPPPPPWAPPPPLLPPTADLSYWHPPQQRGSKDGWVPNVLTQGTLPCFTPPLTTTRFSAPLVPGIPTQAMYKADNSIAIPRGQRDFHLHFDFHPSKETVDAAIGDVLAKPLLSLPLGLKPPSLESVMVELQRQGISTVPPSLA